MNARIKDTDAVIDGSSWYVNSTEEVCVPLVQHRGGDGGVVVISSISARREGNVGRGGQQQVLVIGRWQEIMHGRQQ